MHTDAIQARDNRNITSNLATSNQVDNAYAADPRVLLFKEQDKAEKAARKKARADAIQARDDRDVTGESGARYTCTYMPA